MKKFYVNLVMLIIGIPLLLSALSIFILMRLGVMVVPNTWKLSLDECWSINDWINDKGYYFTHNY